MKNLGFPTVTERFDYFVQKSNDEVFKLAMLLSPILLTKNSLDLVFRHFGIRSSVAEDLFFGFSILKPRYVKPSRLLVFDFISDGTLSVRQRLLGLAYTYERQQVVKVTELMAEDFKARRNFEKIDDELKELQKLVRLDFLPLETSLLNT